VSSKRQAVRRSFQTLESYIRKLQVDSFLAKRGKTETEKQERDNQSTRPKSETGHPEWHDATE